MYVSKDNGKNQYTLCSPDMKEDVLKKMKLTNSLYRALERNELVVYYQPQVSVSTKKIIGFEALLRWNNPEFGLDFTGYIYSIGGANRTNKPYWTVGSPDSMPSEQAVAAYGVAALTYGGEPVS